MRPVIVAYAAITCLLPFLGPVFALGADEILSGAPAPTEQQRSTTNAPSPKRQIIADQLRLARRITPSAQGDEAGERALREVDLLKQLDVIVAQNEAETARQSDLESQLKELRSPAAPQSQDVPDDRSFLTLDRLRDELSSKRSRDQSVKDAVASADDATKVSEQTLANRQKEQRAALAAMRGNKDAAKAQELTAALKVADVAVRIATESLELRKKQAASQRLQLAIHNAQLETLEQEVQRREATAVFSRENLQDQFVELDKSEADLKKAISSAELNLQYADSEWARARKQAETSTMPTQADAERLEAKQLARQLAQTRNNLLNNQLQRVGLSREIWTRRFQLLQGGVATEEVISWRKETRDHLEQLQRDKRLQDLNIDELREEVGVREKELASAGEADTEIRRFLGEQLDSLRQQIQVHNANIVDINGAVRLAEKLQLEIESHVDDWSVEEWWKSAQHQFFIFWNTELTRVDDNPITIGKVLIGVFLVFCGFVGSRMLSRTLGRRLQTGRLRMNESGAAAMQSLTFYVLLVSFTLMALRLVNVPLTMFTFLGGAIAIGVGFGSQNVINNFISGLILLAERPIKVGDLIQLEELYGNVEEIGARSTRIRTGTNLDIIVPNSKFLENNVVNLTLGDDRLRTHISVGVAYGSPCREVARLLKHAASEHGNILSSPEPFVWFVEFGDNSLVFQLHFWLKVRRLTDRFRAESDLRFQIDQLFRNAGIVIAFPQRDIHLHATQPLDVRLHPTDDVIDDTSAA